MKYWASGCFNVQAICDTIRSMAQPIFAEYIGMYQIEAIEFEKLSLGTLPPILHGEYALGSSTCWLNSFFESKKFHWVSFVSSMLKQTTKKWIFGLNFQHNSRDYVWFLSEAALVCLIFQFGFLYKLAGIKVYETNEKELAMEPAIKWAGNPNIILVLKWLPFRITIQVRRA